MKTWVYRVPWRDKNGVSRVSLSGLALVLLGGLLGVAISSWIRAPLPTSSVMTGDLPKCAAESPEKRAKNDAGNQISSCLVDETLVNHSLALPARISRNGRIGGMLRLRSGQGLDGVLITATPTESAEFVRTSARKDLKNDVRKFVHERVLKKALTVTAVTDFDGNFELTGISSGTYEIDVEVSGFLLIVNGKKMRTYFAGENLDIIASPAGGIDVRVRLQDGRLPSTATVFSQRPRRGVSRFDWPTADIQLPAGQHWLWAETGEQKSLRQSVQVRPGQQNLTVHLNLQQTTGIYGSILAQNAADYLNPRVTYLRIVDNGSADESLLKMKGERHSIRAGHYRIDDLRPGTYLVGVQLNRPWRIAISEVIELRGGMRRLDFRLPPSDDQALLIVRALDERGEAIENIGVKTIHREAERRISDQTSTQTRLDGATLVRVSAAFTQHCESPDALCEAIISAHGRGTRKVLVPKAKTPEITVRFDAQATLEVTIDGYHEHPAADGLTLELLPDRSMGRFERNVHAVYGNKQAAGKISIDGIARLGPTESGRYTLALHTGRRSSFRASSRIINLKPGANQVRLRIPPLYDLSVYSALESDEYMTIRQLDIGEAGTRGVSSQFSQSGILRYYDLPEGNYRLSAMALSSAAGVMEFSIPAPGDSIDFKPLVAKAIEITLSSSPIDWAARGIRDGDLIIGRNGTPFGDQTEAFLFAMGPAAATTTALLLMRNGQQFSLDVNLTVLKQLLGGDGVTLDPVAGGG